MKYGVIDIGSNSVRLLMASGGKTLYKDLNTTRLGEGLALSGVLSAAAMYRTAFAVRDFKERALREGASDVFAFATAAVRAAQNGFAFVQLVKETAGLVVDVISGEEEAAIGLAGAIGGASDGGIIDVGGGSTELTLRVGGSVARATSVDVGAVRLYDLCGRDREKLTRTAKEKISSFAGECTVPVFAIGGTATSLGALALGLMRYDPQKVDGYVLTAEKLDELIDGIFARSPEEIAAQSCLPLRRAEIVGGGAVLIREAMRLLELEQLTVSERDNLEGYLLRRLGQ